jgi:hypothetical protein
MSLSKSIIIFLSIFLLSSCAVNRSVLAESSESLFATASKNAEQANEGFKRSDKFVRGWLELADPKTGLIPRNTRTCTGTLRTRQQTIIHLWCSLHRSPIHPCFKAK